MDCPPPYFFSLCLILRYRSGQLGLKGLRSPKDGAYPYSFSRVVLAWIDAKGRRRVPLAFLPYFAKASCGWLVPFGVCARGGAVRRLVRGSGSMPRADLS